MSEVSAAEVSQVGSVTGSADGVFASILLPIEKLEKILPESFELVPLVSQMSDVHPVAIFFGQNSGAGLKSGEVRYMIPNVRVNGSDELFTFVPSSLIESRPSEATDPNLVVASFEFGADEIIALIEDHEIASVKIERITSFDARVLAANLSFNTYRDQRFITKSGETSFLCSRLRYDYQSAVIEPVRLVGRIDFGFPGVIANDFITRHLAENPLGSYSIKANFSKSGAVPCLSL